MMPDGGYQAVAVRDLKSFVTVDLAATKKTSSDFTVFAQWAVTPPMPPYDRPNLLLVRLMRQRMESPEHMRKLRDFLIDGIPGLRISYVGIEVVTFGLSLAQTYKRIRGLPPLRELKADNDKVLRSIGAGALSIDGRLYIPAMAPWGESWIQEHTVFPNGTHDDMVDCTAYAERCLVTYHDFGARQLTEDHTPLPGDQGAGRTIEERFKAHMRSIRRPAKLARQAQNRL
jgi:predicted phage terminase large subunit-like protein